MLPLIITGWLITVACFLLYVRRLRKQSKLFDAQSYIDGINKAIADTGKVMSSAGNNIFKLEDSPIANSEQYSTEAEAFLSLLTAEERENFLENFKNDHHKQSVNDYLTNYMVGRVNPTAILYLAFSWSASKQGYDYWCKVEERLKKPKAITAPIVKPDPLPPTLPKIPRGWKKADGKTRHVKRGLVDTLHRDGEILRGFHASKWKTSWHHSSGHNSMASDIIAYRVCKPKKRVTVKKRVTK